MAAMTKTEQALKLVRQMQVVRPKDLLPYGIAPVYLRRLIKTGELTQTARSLYKLPEHKKTTHHRLAEASKRIPNGVVCLLSALFFHGLAKQPSQVWLAIGRKARKPVVSELPIRFVRFPATGLQKFTEQHVIEWVPVRVTTCAKTITDCFRYRNKIGMDVALEALRQCLRQRRCSKAELLKCAVACRISTVVRPHLEALLTN